MTVPPISVGFELEPLLMDNCRHFDSPKSAICECAKNVWCINTTYFNTIYSSNQPWQTFIYIWIDPEYRHFSCSPFNVNISVHKWTPKAMIIKPLKVNVAVFNMTLVNLMMV